MALPVHVIAVYTRTCTRYNANSIMSHQAMYTPLEKEIVYELVEKHRDILENKSNNAKMICLKESVWKQLAEEFNSR